MATRTYQPPAPQRELPMSIGIGVAAAIALFVVMALAQMMGKVTPPESAIDETLVAFTPPEVVEVEEEEPPPPEAEEPPPELEKEPPQLSLDQLDIALNPGTGGSLAGDFAMPAIATSQRDLGTEDFVDFSALDQVPRPIGARLNFPRRLLKKKVRGQVVVMLKLDEEGRVLDVQLDSSTLPDFDQFVLATVEDWRFTPPTQQGRAVKAQARLPIPINIQ